MYWSKLVIESDEHNHPYLKQSVTLTAFGGDTFQKAIEGIEEINRLFSRNFPQDVLETWASGEFNVFSAINTGN